MGFQRTVEQAKASGRSSIALIGAGLGKNADFYVAVGAGAPMPRDAEVVHVARMCDEESQVAGRGGALGAAPGGRGPEDGVIRGAFLCRFGRAVVMLGRGSALQWSRARYDCHPTGTESCPRNGSKRPKAAVSWGLSGGSCRTGPWSRGRLSA